VGISIIRRLPPHNLGQLNKINRHRVKVPVSEFVVSDVVNLSIRLASIVKWRVTQEKKIWNDKSGYLLKTMITSDSTSNFP
jgi:hypothetical protein